MAWIINTLKASIGKKLMMAITGLGFIGFLITHLGGNLTIYGGKDSFLAYVEKLHSLGLLITAAEWILLTMALVHVITGLMLFIQNLNARPVRYAVNASAGGRTIGSRTMPYTGIGILIFVIFHLIEFHFVDKTSTNIFQIMSEAFQQPAYIIGYVLAVLLVTLHVSHGLWSASQTIGVNHPKYTNFIRGFGIVFSVAILIGFGFLPIYVSAII